MFGSSLFAIKICFKSTKNDLFGVAYMIINPVTTMIEKCDAIVSTTSIIQTNIDLQQPVTNIRNMVSGYKFKGNYLQTSSIEIQQSLLKLPRNMDQFSQICSFAQNEDIQAIRKIFLEVIQMKFSSVPLEIDIILEKVSSQNEEDIPSSNSSSGDIANEQNVLSGVFVELSLVIDPIDGRRLKHLEKGDYIYTKLDRTNETTSKIADTLNLTSPTGESSDICIAKITKIVDQNEKFKLIVTIGNNTYGQIIEEENILISLPSKQEVELFEKKKEDINPNLIKSKNTSSQASHTKSKTSKDPNYQKELSPLSKTHITLVIAFMVFVVILIVLILAVLNL